MNLQDKTNKMSVFRAQRYNKDFEIQVPSVIYLNNNTCGTAKCFLEGLSQNITAEYILIENDFVYLQPVGCSPPNLITS